MAIKLAVLVEDKSFYLSKFCRTKKRRFTVLTQQEYLQEIKILTTNIILIAGPTVRINALYDLCSKLNEKEMRSLNTISNFASENKVSIESELLSAENM